MFNINLTQYVQNLKSLQQTLSKICNDCRQTQNSLTDLQAQSRCLWQDVNGVWSQTIDLFGLLDNIIEEIVDNTAHLKVVNLKNHTPPFDQTFGRSIKTKGCLNDRIIKKLFDRFFNRSRTINFFKGPRKD